MARADILETPPEFTQEHLDWMDAQVAILEAAVYNVSDASNIAAEVNKVKGARQLRLLVAANIAQRSN